MAGYYAHEINPDLAVVSLAKEKSGHMAYRITMGVRPSDQEWKRTLNKVIKENQPEINRILGEYHVPLLGDAAPICFVAAVLLMNTGVNLAGAEGNAPEPEGYRTEMYRAPVPATLKGAKVVTTDEAVALWKDKETVFIDVLPYDPKPANLPAGTIWRDKMREDIPGSIWLANTGYGILNKETEAYFRKGLESRLGHEKNRRVLFYCMENCWMSWNAAKRAVEWGYRS
eukprot:gene29146-35608_t